MGSFPKCDSSGTALDSGLLASGPGSLAAGDVCGQATVQLQGDTLRSSCLWQIHPSSLHLSGCTGLNKVLGEDQHSPFSEPEHHILTPHLSSMAGWVRSSTRWLWGWSRAEEVVIWTYCQSMSFDSNRDPHQCEMGGDFPDLFWGFLFPATMLARSVRKSGMSLGFEPLLVNMVAKEDQFRFRWRMC